MIKTFNDLLEERLKKGIPSLDSPEEVDRYVTNVVNSKGYTSGRVNNASIPHFKKYTNSEGDSVVVSSGIPGKVYHVIKNKNGVKIGKGLSGFLNK